MSSFIYMLSWLWENGVFEEWVFNKSQFGHEAGTVPISVWCSVLPQDSIPRNSSPVVAFCSWTRTVNYNTPFLYTVSLLWQYFISRRKWTKIPRLASFLEPLSEHFSSLLPVTQGALLRHPFFHMPYVDITLDWDLILTSYVGKEPFSTEDHLLSSWDWGLRISSLFLFFSCFSFF